MPETIEGWKLSLEGEQEGKRLCSQLWKVVWVLERL